jgi:hypothetical protein
MKEFSELTRRQAATGISAVVRAKENGPAIVSLNLKGGNE